MVFVALFAGWLAPHDYAETTLTARNAPPFWYDEFYESKPDLPRYILGADPLGRDVLSRLIYGARISLMLSAVATVTGVTVGTILGMIAGYRGGIVDEAISRFVDIWYALPFILLAMIATIIFTPSLSLILVLLALLAWSGFVRNVRAEVLVLRNRDYVMHARVSGASVYRIMWRHIFPGIINTVTVIATIRIGTLILSEATLSYLGAGIPSPQPAWGLMVSEGSSYIRQAWWTTFFPGLAIVLLVLALNFFGDWLRDKLDPRLRQLST
jgi:peptide/nickel transport system permease protein